jgi:hypothetical protein
VIAPKSVAEQFRKKKKFIIQEVDPAPPDRISYMVTHRLPRIGALQGIEILAYLMRKSGYFNVEDQAGIAE